jgi:hypothetical protein
LRGRDIVRIHAFCRGIVRVLSFHCHRVQSRWLD